MLTLSCLCAHTAQVTTARQMARMRLMETGFEERIKKDKERKLSRK